MGSILQHSRTPTAQPSIRWTLCAAPLGSATLYALSLPPVGAWPLAYFCLVPWLWAARTIGQGALMGAAMGMVLGPALGWWIPSSLELLGASQAQGWGALFLLAAWAKGLPFAVLGAVAGATWGCRISVRLFSIPAAFFAADQLLSLAPLGVPLALLGHSQWTVPGVAQLAVLGGVPTVSAAIALANVLVVETIRPTAAGRLATASFAGAGLALAALWVPLSEWLGPSEDRLRVMAVQTAVRLEERWAPHVQGTHVAAALRTARDGLARETEPVSVILLPEMLITSPLDRSPALEDRLREAVETMNTPILTGTAMAARSGRSDRYQNAALMFPVSGPARTTAQKQVGVPVVETLSSIHASVASAALGWEPRGLAIEAANATDAQNADHEFTIAFCYEVLFPSLVANRRTSEAQAILVLSDDSWLRTSFVSTQSLPILAFRAIEQRLPLLRVGQGGGSAWLDRFGRVLQTLPDNEWGTMIASLGAPTSPVWVDRVGIASLATLGAVLGNLAFRAFQQEN